ncbi:MAG: hypothetical protein A4E30_00249 [Methanomassiliicoccales archaeon PtaB.Bin215]|nr:MAG: hypothetical protein A4E30_00249 [Methanomassiliicoccales archaeon PtaB.Bin215]
MSIPFAVISTQSDPETQSPMSVSTTQFVMVTLSESRTPIETGASTKEQSSMLTFEAWWSLMAMPFTPELPSVRLNIRHSLMSIGPALFSMTKA